MVGPDPISTLLIVAALVAATGFVGLYLTNSPWRLTNVGRAMMTLAVGLVLLCLTALLFNLLGPNYPFRPLVRNFSYLVLNLGLWWQLINLVKMQNRVNRLPAPRPREDRLDDRNIKPQDKDAVS